MFFRFFAALVLITALAAAENPPVNTKQFEPLANQLIDALQREDIVAYSQCWLSVAQAQEFARQVNKPEAIKEAQEIKPDYDERNRHVAHSFKCLIEAFKKQGNLADLKLVRVGLPRKIYENDGVRSFVELEIAVKLGDTESVIDTGFGVEYQNQWYFISQATHLNVGEHNIITLQLPTKKK